MSENAKQYHQLPHCCDIFNVANLTKVEVKDVCKSGGGVVRVRVGGGQCPIPKVSPHSSALTCGLYI